MDKLIILANPNSWPKDRDLQKISSSLAFFRAMSVSDVCDLVAGYLSGSLELTTLNS